MEAKAVPALGVHLRIEPADIELDATLDAGRRIDVILSWQTGSGRAVHPDRGPLLADTVGAWRR